MRDETRKNLIDILQAAAEIQDFVGGMDFKDYQDNAVTRRSIECMTNYNNESERPDLQASVG